MNNDTITFLNARFEPDEPICLCVIGHPSAPGCVSGVFDDRSPLLDAIEEYDGMAHLYVNLNRLFSGPIDCFRHNQVDFESGWRFRKHHVERRTGLLFDIDSDRESPMATAEQLAAANELSDRLRRELEPKLGKPVTDTMTGNGRQIIYAIDEPVDSDLPKRILKKQAARFNNATAHIDTGVHDAARIVRVPGTLNIKGLPERRSYLIPAASAAHNTDGENQ